MSQIYALEPDIIRFHPDKHGSDVPGEARTDQPILDLCIRASIHFLQTAGPLDRVKSALGYRKVLAAMPEQKTIGKIAAIDPDRLNFEMSASFTGLQANCD